MPPFNLSDPIPTGSWCLYYHNPADTKWTPESYQKLASVKTWGDTFAVLRELQDSSIQYGMFFWMRDGIPPLYENHANIKGGCYSLRIGRQKASHYFNLYTIGAMLGQIVTNPEENTIQGISISPKRVVEKNQTFNVIKVWNKDCTKFNRHDHLVRLDNIQQCSEIIYTPHINKKL
jgi:uncharacterized protein YeaC (DUF1315 family)